MDWGNIGDNSPAKEVIKCSLGCICSHKELKYQVCESCNNTRPLFCKMCNCYSEAEIKAFYFQYADQLTVDNDCMRGVLFLAGMKSTGVENLEMFVQEACTLVENKE